MSLGFTINKEKNGALLAYITSSISNINLRITNSKFSNKWMYLVNLR